MKFGKRLQSQIDETLPEWRDKYLSYKQLKKRLKSISAPDCFTDAAFSSPEHDLPPPPPPPPPSMMMNRAELHDGNAAPVSEAEEESHGLPAPSEGRNSSLDSPDAGSALTGSKSSSGSVPDDCHQSLLTAEEADFIHLLNAELEKFNTFFMEKEEEYVIRLQELKERCERMKDKRHTGMSPDSEEMIIIRKEIVNFHGEMVLLENYSSLNYTGLVKILKKHDKRTGALLRMPFIRNVLQQPFFTTELLSKLVRECEMNLQSLFPSPSAFSASRANQEEPLPAAAAAAAASNDYGSLKESAEKTTNSKGELEPSVSANRDDGSQKEGENASLLNGEELALPGEQTNHEGEDVDSIYRSTLAALRTIKELRKGSSTYNVFSLPPFSREDDSEDKDLPPCTTIPIYPRD